MQREAGYSKVEYLLAVALIGLVATLTFSNYQNFVKNSYDQIAESDYLNLKTVVFNALASPNAPLRFIFTNKRGPVSLPSPLNSEAVSKDIEVSVFHQTVRSRLTRPTTATTMLVYHVGGSKKFSYSEVNGVVTEQVIER